MQSTTIKHMEHFIGKICTIITPAINRNFDDVISREHFAVRVLEVTRDGVWGMNPNGSNTASFFNMNYIVSIHEEIALDPDNPEHKELIEEYEKKTGQKLESDIRNIFEVVASEVNKPNPLPVVDQKETPEPAYPDSDDDKATFVDIKSLAKLAKETRRAFDMRSD